MATAWVAAVTSSSLRINDSDTSIMVPAGATTVHSTVAELAILQKEARLIGGGRQETRAGVDTDTEVSENSRDGEF